MKDTYEVGTKYIPASKIKRECTVIDIYKTYNNAGELVSLKYVSTHEFCGQIVTEYDVPSSTIARGML